jgi:hypothetical protein
MLAVGAQANPVTVTDVTDWNTTPMEVVNIVDPYLGYSGGVYAGINSLLVTDPSGSAVHDGFCVDPFHWSLDGPVPYNIVPLTSAPKLPGTLNVATANAISELWTEYFSPHMSSSSAAGLQIAIWELVSSNAVASGNLPANEAFALAPGQFDYGAGADIASLANFSGPVTPLEGLTGIGQDYVIDPPPVPDGGATLLMLALAAGALVFARPALLQRADAQTNLCPVRAGRRG